MKLERDDLEERLDRPGWVRDSKYYTLPFEDGTFGVMRIEQKEAHIGAVRNGRDVRFSDVDDVVRCELIRALTIASGEK